MTPYGPVDRYPTQHGAIVTTQSNPTQHNQLVWHIRPNGQATGSSLAICKIGEARTRTYTIESNLYDRGSIFNKKRKVKQFRRHHGETPLETTMISREGGPSGDRWRRRCVLINRGMLFNSRRFISIHRRDPHRSSVSSILVHVSLKGERGFHDLPPGDHHRTLAPVYKYLHHSMHSCTAESSRRSSAFRASRRAS
jgi:hypothetical protein